MKRIVLLITLAAAICAVPVIAHHAAEGIVDEEIYAMIDALVADTPHATMDFSTIGDMTTMTIDVTNYARFEDLVEAGLVMNVSQLDGQVTMTLEFDDSREITITIQQQKPAEKSAAASDEISLDGLKADFR